MEEFDDGGSLTYNEASGCYRYCLFLLPCDWFAIELLEDICPDVNGLLFDPRIPLHTVFLPFAAVVCTLFCSYTTKITFSHAITIAITMAGIVMVTFTARQVHSDGHGSKCEVFTLQWK